MKFPTERELGLREKYREMIRDPQMMPEIGITGRIEFHLYHIARYISRMKGFSLNLKQPLPYFVDTDLGACLLGSVHVVDEEMNKTGDTTFSTLWQTFKLEVDRFGQSDPKIKSEDLEQPFLLLCEHYKFHPGPI